MKNLLWIVLAGIVLVGGYVLITGETPTDLMNGAQTEPEVAAEEADEGAEEAATAVEDAAEDAMSTAGDAVDTAT